MLNSAGSYMHMPKVGIVPDMRACYAVIRIPHPGDCMGMLVRADDIVLRSEIWWAVRYSHSSS